MPTTYLTSGEGDAASLALTGSWDDGLLGWSDHVAPGFSVHRIPDAHVEAMFHPEAAAVLTAALDRAHRAPGLGDARRGRSRWVTPGPRDHLLTGPLW